MQQNRLSVNTNVAISQSKVSFKQNGIVNILLRLLRDFVSFIQEILEKEGGGRTLTQLMHEDLPEYVTKRTLDTKPLSRPPTEATQNNPIPACLISSYDALRKIGQVHRDSRLKRLKHIQKSRPHGKA